MHGFKHDRAALIRCGRDQDHGLNSGKNCLDGRFNKSVQFEIELQYGDTILVEAAHWTFWPEVV
jgi:hypothetical protein